MIQVSQLYDNKELYLVNKHITYEMLPDLFMQINNLPNTNCSCFSFMIDKNPVLEFLFLDYNKISKLPEHIFDKLKNLKSLSLMNNIIKDLPTILFDKLCNLETLFLSHNEIEKLPDKIFVNLPNLKYLYLDNNKIKKIHPCIFDKLSNLRELYLNCNKIESIDYIIFSKLSKLKVLNISFNKIERVHNDIFTGLNILEKLDISNNKLVEIPNNLFDNLSNLSTLLLHGNKLNKLPHGIFNKLHKLTYLYVFTSSQNEKKILCKMTKEKEYVLYKNNIYFETKMNIIKELPDKLCQKLDEAKGKLNKLNNESYQSSYIWSNKEADDLEKYISNLTNQLVKINMCIYKLSKEFKEDICDMLIRETNELINMK